jgi:hypothetical protein
LACFSTANSWPIIEPSKKIQFAPHDVGRHPRRMILSRTK